MDMHQQKATAAVHQPLKLHRQLRVDAIVEGCVQRLQIGRKVEPHDGLVASANPLLDAENDRAARGVAEADGHFPGQVPQTGFRWTFLEIEILVFKIVGDLLIKERQKRNLSSRSYVTMGGGKSLKL